MIDFHAHILPGIDDGSRDLTMTAAMLREEILQGIDLVVATPHFYADRMSIGGFLDKRAAAVKLVEELRRRTGERLPDIAAGAEVYYFSGMGRAKEVFRLCVEGTKTILVEMPFGPWNEEMFQDIESLIRRQNLHVVLAHVERYIGFQRDRRVWNRLLSLPLTPQINAGSFLKSGGWFRSDRKRKFCHDFLIEHPDVIVGSDCHNLSGRAPNLTPALREIEAAEGPDLVKHIDDVVRRTLELRV